MNIRIAMIALATAALGAQASAAGKIGEIRQIDTAQKMAALKVAAGKVAVGDSLIATNKDNTQCSLVVRSVIGTTVTVDTSRCSFSAQLRVGQAVEASMMNTGSNSKGASTSSSGAPSITMDSLKQVAPASETTGVTIFAVYDNADSFKGDFVGGGQSFSETAKSETGFGIGAEYSQFNYRFIGFYGNGAYQFGRQWKSWEANGQKYTPAQKPTLTMFQFGGGVNYLFNDNVYVKGGATYNLPSLASGGPVTDISGKLGYEGGVGVRFARNFNAELLYRKLNFAASGTDNTQGAPIPFTIDNLNQTGFVLRGGYLF